LPGSGRIRAFAAVLVLAGVLAYGNSLAGPFIADDSVAIVGNEEIRSLRPSVVLFPKRERPVAGRPLANLTFALNYAAGGLAPAGYHLVNIGIHLACGLLLMAVARGTLRNDTLAFAIALLWMVHPLNSETVDYLTQRTESLMAFFLLLTLYLSMRDRPALAVAACALGMACKESMVTAPVIVPLHEAIFRFGSFRAAWLARWRFYTALASTWIVLVVVTWSGPRIHSAGFSSGTSAWTYLLNQPRMIVRYLWLAVWPRSLVIDYGPPAAISFSDALPFAVLVVGLLAVTIYALARRPSLGFLGAWFFITLAPASTIVPIATEVGAERRMYLPLVAIVALVVVAAHRVLRRMPPLASFAVLSVVTGLLIAGTVARNREYGSIVGLARANLARWPMPVSHAMLGQALAIDGQHEAAIAELRLAVSGYPNAHYHLGGELFNAGQLDEAVTELESFVAAQPQAEEAPTALTMIGRARMRQRRWPEAIEPLRRALPMGPPNPSARAALADALFAANRFDEAAAEYARIVAADGGNVAAITNLAVALDATGRADLALPYFRRAVDLDPRGAGARNNLTGALLNAGADEEAVVSARQAVEANPGDAMGRDLLGRALAARGQLREAAAEFQRALSIDPAFAQAREDLARVVQANAGRR
jgi:protein O-mannosyl-transferase